MFRYYRIYHKELSRRDSSSPGNLNETTPHLYGIFMCASPASEKTCNGPSPGNVLNEELSAVRKKHIELLSPEKPGFLHRFILFSCILTNVIFFFTMSDYFAIFIAASFYLNMFYFVILLIPTNSERTGLSKNEILRFHAWLRDNGIKSGTSRFTRLFINSFFMNSRALSLGIGLIFSVDIVFAIVSYIIIDLPLITTVIVIAQCAVIILFYLLVWKIEPSSTKFERNVEQVRRRLSRGNIPPWVVSAIFMSGILLAVFLFLTTIILLPGMTVTAFMSQSGLNKLAYLVLFITILAVSQYFLIRHIHGITSRVMAIYVLDFQEDVLKELAGIPYTGSFRKPDEGKDRFEMTALLLESRTYSVQKHTLLDIFPVYTVDIDVSALMDTATRSAIERYIEKQKDHPEDQ